MGRVILALSAICSLLILLAFTLPRWISPQGEGFTPAAETAFLFLILLSAALLLSVLLVIFTLIRYRQLPLKHRIAGFAPLVLIALSAFALNIALTSPPK